MSDHEQTYYCSAHDSALNDVFIYVKVFRWQVKSGGDSKSNFFIKL